MSKIAFCFLLYDKVKHNKEWETFFKGDSTKSHTIYSHLKTINEETQDWIKENKIKSIKTGWCEESLVYAWIRMIKEGLRNPKNKYFILLSGECIPLYTFNETYKKIMNTKKSFINIDDEDIKRITGLYWASQWCILHRKHARLLVKLIETEEGKEFMKLLRNRLCSIYNPDPECYCPDNLFPVNWFIYKYDCDGNPYSKKFLNDFKIGKTTFETWDKSTSSPDILTLSQMKKIKKEICDSGAIFARKFNSKASGELAMSCGKKIIKNN